EAARGRSEVEGDAAGDGEAELIQRGRELVAAPRRVARSLVDREVGVRIEQDGGAIRPLPADPDPPSKDQRLGTLAARSEAALHEKLVEAHPGGHGPRIASTHATIRDARLRPMPKRMPRSRTLKGSPKIVYYDSGGGVAGEPPIVL